MTDQASALMSCEHVIRLLWEYLDNELDAERRLRVREHLAVCEHCREHFTFEGAFLRAVASHLDDVTDTATLRGRIVDALRAEGYHERV
jgi:anti-sigma factor (TIGR02949 family)